MGEGNSIIYSLFFNLISKAPLQVFIPWMRFGNHQYKQSLQRIMSSGRMDYSRELHREEKERIIHDSVLLMIMTILLQIHRPKRRSAPLLHTHTMVEVELGNAQNKKKDNWVPKKERKRHRGFYWRRKKRKMKNEMNAAPITLKFLNSFPFFASSIPIRRWIIMNI